MEPQPRAVRKRTQPGELHRRIVVSVAILAVAMLGATMFQIHDNVGNDTRLHWARTSPPFVADLAVTKPRGIVEMKSADAAHSLAVIDLAAVRKGEAPVPPLYFARVPDDLIEHATSETEKRLFLQLMLPLVLRVNADIERLRDRLLDIRSRRNGLVSREDQDFVNRLARWYGVADGDIDALLRRVDKVPPSLVIAQAVEESGWGKSRFTRIANALFGQHVFRPDRPQVPHPVEGTPPIRAFPDLISSISTYMHNLNTHKAYADFRTLRSEARAADALLDSKALAEKLTRYSERGEDYVAAIKTHIDANELWQFDKAQLAE